ncbi:hypothetical protein J7J81_02270 [bacterium]|nr:hypothetical protein [bacterium]
MTKTKLLYLGTGIFIALLVLISTTNLKHSLCSGHYTVNCWQESGTQEPNRIIKEHIPCANNRDCFVALKLESFCSPGYPNFLKCAGARYYCRNEGYCKGCVCPWYSPAYWLSVD